MKCPACGYEKRDVQYEVDEVVRYKSGKRKGEIKGSETRVIEPDEHKTDFKSLYFKKDVDELGWDDQPHYWDDQFTEAKIVACPECGNLFATNATY